MATLNNLDDLVLWLKEQPSEVAIAIAARAALSALPATAALVRSEPEKWAPVLMLPLFRAMAPPWFAGTWPNLGGDAALAAPAALERTMNDARRIDAGASAEELMRDPLWLYGFPAEVRDAWRSLKADLRSVNPNWSVWTDWYEDRLVGGERPNGRPVIQALERERLLIDDVDWEKGPDHVLPQIAEIEARHAAARPTYEASLAGDTTSSVADVGN
ncbi:MAG: hypothetical protein P8N43_08945, partial [Alphaproteobacteria bacterium]|nr:hypothetical protein [Alphaproteobacteria bacterium]